MFYIFFQVVGGGFGSGGGRWGSKSRRHLCVVSTHGSRAAFGAPGVALMWIWVRVVLHLIVPGLDVVSRRAVPGEQRQNKDSVRKPGREPLKNLKHAIRYHWLQGKHCARSPWRPFIISSCKHFFIRHGELQTERREKKTNPPSLLASEETRGLKGNEGGDGKPLG